MLLGFAILFGFQLLGESVVRFFELPLPGHVTGMALLAMALGVRVVRLEWVRPAARALLDHLGLLFVPAGVGVMAHGELIAEQWVPISVALVTSTLLVMGITGRVATWLEPHRDAGLRGRTR